MNSSATIKDIALRCGVSTATVSYVLNNREGAVGSETRERILSAMRELNYRPRALSVGKNARQTDTLGVVFMHLGHSPLMERPYFACVLDGILSVTTQRHLHTTLFTITNWHDAHRSLRVYCDGRCDGLILIAPLAQNPILDALKERGTPFVVINAASEDPLVSSVDVDNVEACFALSSYVLAQGHRRIAFLEGDSASENAALRKRGFLQAVTQAELDLNQVHCIRGQFTQETGYARTRIILDQPRHLWPTALICCSDQIARGAHRALEEGGVSIPTQMSVVGFDDLPFAALLHPPLTTVRQPLHAMGEHATNLLLNQLETGRTPQKALLPAEVIVRDSVAVCGAE